MATVFATVTTPGPPGPTGPPGYSPVYIVAAGPPSAAVGSDHDMYINSSTGDVYGPKINGVWGPIVCNIKGATGATGATGPAGYSPQYIVAAGPPGAVGNNGDMYINSTTSDVYGPKASGAWGGIVCNIKGQQGPPGVGFRPMGAWSSSVTYLQGDQVTYNSQLWISLQGGNLNNVPTTSPTWWQPVGSGGSQTPWLQDIDGATFRLKNTGNVGIGTDLSVLPNAGTQVHLVVGGPPSTPFGRITVASNSASIGTNVGAFTFANYAITAAEKRIAQIVGTCDGAVDSGAMLFYTFVASAANERMRISAAGLVGIGTGSPSAPLHVFSPTVDATILIEASATRTPYVNFRRGGQNWYEGPGINGDNNWSLYNQTAGKFNIVVTTAGNVGIGTLSPLQPLSLIAGNPATAATANQFTIGETSNNPAYRLALGFFSDTAWKGSIQATANGPAAGVLLLNPLGGVVGIGTTAPLGQFSLGNPASDANLKPWPNMDQGSIAFYQAQNFPGANNYQRVLDIVAGGSNTGGNIRFLTQVGSAVGKVAMFINPSGYVGIETTAPQVPFHVCGPGGVPAASPPAAGTYGGNVIIGNDTPLYGMYLGTLNNGYGYIQQQRGDGSATTYNLLLQPNGGFVGIGTTAPLCRLDVVTGNTPSSSPNSGTGGFRIGTDPWASANSLWAGADGNLNAAWLQAAQATVGNIPLLLQPNGGNVTIGSTGVYLPLTVNAGAAADANLSAGTGGLMLYASNGVCVTAGIGSSAVGVWFQSKFLSSDGRAFPLALNPLGGGVAIGKYGPGYALDVVGDLNISGTFRVNGNPFTSGITGVQVQQNGSGIGTFPTINFVNGGSGTIARCTPDVSNNRALVAIDTPSDLRIKQNVANLSGGVSVIASLRPVAFEYNGACGFKNGKRSASIIAQELREVLPDAVYTSPTAEVGDLLCFDPMQIIAHLILATQQLERRLKDVEQRVN